ncbi:hypothetical protein K461DRAFT_219279 [Myriangium duriaei CBS 260.36]|uniref:SPRY domain-containing protein n=1 Tax=Myriangium duriaei CBS 260.36 TaxID=1168546 RepID=A0A9P4MKQ9_9PEZI|nr:hypothetical protein K461DRAFT_219279 [Myriangium duriaei CBS 260.36]
MAEDQQSPVAAAPIPSPIPAAVRDHSPAVSSPLNPEPAAKPKPARPPPREREQREKKDSLKKRESALNAKDGISSTVPSKRKASSAASPTAPSPMRYSIPPPRISDYDPPRHTQFASHEPFPFVTPDGEIELKKPLDHAENKKGYRYNHCIADPLFRHKQFYRETDTEPFGARMSFEDADKWMHFDTTGLSVTNEKGWRMARANVCAREGSLYYEVRIVRGVPAEDEAVSEAQAGPLPHVRMGWARREASLDAPVGFDGYSYGITDARFETMHRSRSGKLFVSTKTKKQGGSKKPPGSKLEKEIIDLKDNIREGDVVGLEINLPSISLHQKVVNGVYNPAVDLGDGFDDAPAINEPGTEPYDIIRDRIPVPYKGNVYFETMDYVPTRFMDAYSDRTLSLSNLSSQTSGPNAAIKIAPNANHPEPSLRTLPHSSVKVYKNGQLIGTAFEDLLAFLPPASNPSKAAGAREGFDDGLLGYFPAIACFSGGIAEVNFGQNGFWMPPAHLRSTASGHGVWRPGRALRPAAERFKEQVAEDVVWDIIDEVDFFMQDGGFGGKVGAGAGEARQGVASLKEEAD